LYVAHLSTPIRNSTATVDADINDKEIRNYVKHFLENY